MGVEKLAGILDIEMPTMRERIAYLEKFDRVMREGDTVIRKG